MTNTLGNSFQLSRHNFYKLLYKNDINRLKLDDDAVEYDDSGVYGLGNFEL